MKKEHGIQGLAKAHADQPAAKCGPNSEPWTGTEGTTSHCTTQPDSGMNISLLNPEVPQFLG